MGSERTERAQTLRAAAAMAGPSTKQFLSGRSLGLRGSKVCNGSRLFMKQKYSLNVQIITGERENFEVSEKRFDREVLNAGVQREVRRRSQFENPQDMKKREEAEEKVREQRKELRPGLVGPVLRRRPREPQHSVRRGGPRVQVPSERDHHSLQRLRLPLFGRDLEAELHRSSRKQTYCFLL